MRNINIRHFLKWGVLPSGIEYAIISKQFDPSYCRCRMINNIEVDEDNFISRITTVLHDCAYKTTVSHAFTWDKELGTNTFIFKVGVIGHLMLASKEMDTILEVLGTEDKKAHLIEELRTLREEMIQILEVR